MTRYKFETTEHELFRKTFRKFLAEEAEPHYAQWEKNHLIPPSFGVSLVIWAIFVHK